MRHENKAKDQARAKIQADVAAYLARGGVIEQMDTRERTGIDLLRLHVDRNGDAVKMRPRGQ